MQQPKRPLRKPLKAIGESPSFASEIEVKMPPLPEYAHKRYGTSQAITTTQSSILGDTMQATSINVAFKKRAPSSVSSNNTNSNELFLATKKRIIPGEANRWFQFIRLRPAFGDDSLLEEILSPGLKRSNTTKDVRRHARNQTKLDETESMESGKSKDGASSKIRNALNELETLRRQNELLEARLKKIAVENKNGHEEEDKNVIWKEVEGLVSLIMEKLTNLNPDLSTKKGHLVTEDVSKPKEHLLPGFTSIKLDSEFSGEKSSAPISTFMEDKLFNFITESPRLDTKLSLEQVQVALDKGIPLELGQDFNIIVEEETSGEKTSPKRIVIKTNELNEAEAPLKLIEEPLKVKIFEFISSNNHTEANDSLMLLGSENYLKTGTSKVFNESEDESFAYLGIERDYMKFMSTL